MVTIKQNLNAFWKKMSKLTLRAVRYFNVILWYSFYQDFLTYFFSTKKVDPNPKKTRGHREDNVFASGTSEARFVFRAGATFSSRPSARRKTYELRRDRRNERSGGYRSYRPEQKNGGVSRNESWMVRWRSGRVCTLITRLALLGLINMCALTESRRYRSMDKLSGLCAR